MKRLYLDCEFNGYGGELISIALVGAPRTPNGDVDGVFYAGSIRIEKSVPWVEANVVPQLNAGPWPFAPYHPRVLAEKLVTFLDLIAQTHGGWVDIVADHPADFVHLSQLLDRWSAGHEFASPPFQISMRLVHSGELDSRVPHNALEDALALARWGERHLGA